MGRLHINMMGMKFGSLTVVSRGPNTPTKEATWLCLCECGKEIFARGSNLRGGHYKSCGCKKYRDRTTHGMSKTKLFKVWINMRERCLSPKCPAYKDYGGRGISIGIEFGAFIDFYKWAISSGYKEGLTIDRKNNDGNYTPDNCRWGGYAELIIKDIFTLQVYDVN